MTKEPAIWFPTVRTGTGTDVFTERLCEGLNARGIHTEITWLPLRAEYAPWTVAIPTLPVWATVVHVNTWLHSRFIPDRLPVIATVHHAVHDPALRPYKGTVRATYHRLWIAPNERRVMLRANRVIAVSQFAANIARQMLCNAPMQVIYNGIDTHYFRPFEGISRPHQPFRLLYVGSWITRKGVDLLAPIMRELGNGFMLHYTGGIAAENDKFAMPSNMRDIGHLTKQEIAAAMQQADAFLFPSRSEGFGLAVAEAMACGLPVIATRGSSLTEVVDDGVTGVLCPQDQVPLFVNAIRDLQCDPRRARAMGDAGRKRVKAIFNVEDMFEAYASISRLQTTVKKLSKLQQR